ncbi:MAG TPA: FAD-binding oxidoreductase [Acidimicrobiales bacterium]|nr:FAD-binding oxidoreductase [Acidimicrobiales bacterium]
MTLIETVTRQVLGSPLIEALAWPHGVDRYLELIKPHWSLSELRGTITAVSYPTAETVALTVRPSANWAGHLAGQHVNVGVTIDGTIHTRCYSVTDAEPAPDGATPAEFGLCIKSHPEGLVSKYLAAHATVGMSVLLGPAEGTFTLPDTRPERTVLISGGSGITPVLSMLRTLCARGHDRPVSFVHYSFGPHDALYADEVAGLAAKYPNVTSVRAYTDHHAGDLTGLFRLGHLDAVDPEWRQSEIFLCGPPGLMGAVTEVVDAAGRAEHLHTERFELARIPNDADRASATGTVTFVGDGAGPAGTVTLDNSGEPLLVQAEKAGLTPVYGCRMGICHTCTRPKKTGCVRNAVTGQLSDLGAEDIQICISAPVGDVVVDL